MGFTVKRVLRRGSEKAVSRRCPERPPGEYARLGVRPILGRRLPNGKPQQRLRFRDLRGKTLAFKKRMAITSCDLEVSLGARACIQVLCVQKTAAFCVLRS